jgi:[ribosomal protein S18]-alanine N-acetyltransferase
MSASDLKSITASASTIESPIEGLRTRAMTYNDLLYIAGIEQTSYAFPWSDGIFRDCIKAGYFCRVAEVRRDVIGYALMSMGAGEAHVLNVCVRMDFRDHGIGRYFMNILAEHARASGCHDMFLEVRPSNPAAIHLYETLGYNRVGVRKGYYQATQGREDAWVYKKELVT